MANSEGKRYGIKHRLAQPGIQADTASPCRLTWSLGVKGMKLFIAHFILVEDAPRAVAYYVTSSLFAEKDAESAYSTAQSWVSGHEDSTHNPSGELVRYYSTGLFELEEASVELERVALTTRETYGVDVGHLKLTLSTEPPSPKSKEELAVFVCAAQPAVQPDGHASGVASLADARRGLT